MRPAGARCRATVAPVLPATQSIARDSSFPSLAVASCVPQSLSSLSEDNDWGTQLATASEGKLLSRAIDCVAGRTGATVARHLAPGGRMLVYGALSSHRQTDPSAFEMPVFAPRLIYSAAAVQGWYLLQ